MEHFCTCICAQLCQQYLLDKTIARATAFICSLSIGLFPECSLTPNAFFFSVACIKAYCAHLPGVKHLRAQLIKAVSQQSSPNNTELQPSKEKIKPAARTFSFAFHSML